MVTSLLSLSREEKEERSDMCIMEGELRMYCMDRADRMWTTSFLFEKTFCAVSHGVDTPRRLCSALQIRYHFL